MDESYAFDPLTELEKERVTGIHQERMARCYCEFRGWLATQGLMVRPEDPRFTDAALVRYVQHCRDHEVPFWRAKFSILGTQHMHRALRWQLPRSWDGVTA